MNLVENEVDELIKININLKKIITKEYINIFKEYMWSKFINELNEKVKNILLVQNGAKTFPGEIGLFKLWNYRNQLKINCNEIMEYEKIKIKSLYMGTSAIIPNKGEVQYIKSIKPFILKEEGWKKYSNPSIKDMTKILKNIKNISNLTKTPSLKDIKKLSESIINQELNDQSFITHMGAIHKIYIENNQRIPKETIKLSDGEQSALILNIILDISKKFILLDEPSNYLGSQLVATSLVPKIQELKNAGATIVIATHDPNLAINSLPVNMIYRKYSTDNKYFTHYGNWWEKKFDNDEDFKIVVTDNFEGGMKSFDLREGIYKDDFKNQKN